MNLRRLLLIGLLGFATDGYASAQTVIGPAGVTVTTQSGTGITIPNNNFNGVPNASGTRGVVLSTPNRAIDTNTGAVYVPAYQSQSPGVVGRTYMNPVTGGYFNPGYGDFTTPPYAYRGTSALGGQFPGYQSNGVRTYVAPVVRGVRVR